MDHAIFEYEISEHEILDGFTMGKKATLFIDADDTLWHNNIYFEQAIVGFSEMMEKLGHCRQTTERFIRTREMDNVKYHGYGSVSLTISMKQVYEEICTGFGREMDCSIVEEIEEHGRSCRDYPIMLLPGVQETLPLLSRHYTLVLVTKGNNEEQKTKVDRSGVKKYFRHLIIVQEKSPKVYQYILDKFNLEPSNTWMIGNSPRSDINPAKAVGMRTALIPYKGNWEFENEKVNNDGHETIVLNEFSDLAILFNLAAA